MVKLSEKDIKKILDKVDLSELDCTKSTSKCRHAERKVKKSIDKMLKKMTFHKIVDIAREIMLDYAAIEGGPIPVILRLYELNEEHHFIQKILEKLHLQNQNEVSKMVEKIPDYQEKYIDELTKMVIDGKTEQEIFGKSEVLMQEFSQQLTSSQEFLNIIAEVKEIEEWNNTHPFNLDEFREEVKRMVEEMRSELKNATNEEKDEIATYVLATNEKYNELLSKIEGDKAFDKVNKRAKKEVIESLENDEIKNFDAVSQEITEKTERIEQTQLIHIEDKSLRLSSPWDLRPGHQYVYTVEDLMVDHRDDIDFFEFVSMTADFKSNQKVTEKEKYVYVIPESITGVAPLQEGSFNFKASLKYTSFRYGGEPKIFETTFTLNVGEKYSQTHLNARWVMFYVIWSLGIFAMITVCVISYKKYKKSKQIKYETWKVEDNSQISTFDNGSTSDVEDIEVTLGRYKE